VLLDWPSSDDKVVIIFANIRNNLMPVGLVAKNVPPVTMYGGG